MSQHVEPTALVGNADERQERVSLVRVALIFVRWRRMITLVVVIAAVLTGVLTALRPRSYTATASFACKTPQTGQISAGLAAQFGLAVGGANSQSPQFYADLIQSRAILGAVAESTYVVPTDSGPQRMTLIQASRRSDDTPARARDRAISDLRKAVSAKISTGTDVVTVSVTQSSPTLAASVARVLVARLNDFNLRERQTQAGQEREFTEQRLAHALGELHAAEDALAAFHVANRDFTRSPLLSLEAERLQRMVASKQQVYTSLAQGYEQARIDELRDTPVIMPIETPEAPTLPDPRGLVRNVILALLVSFFAAGLIAILAEYVRAIRQTDRDDVRELAAMWRRRKSG